MRKILFKYLILIFFIGCRNYESVDVTSDEAGKNENINDLFLPSSTTNDIVKHNYYVLSYNEAHEQAEWVAYELKKEEIVYTNHERPYFIYDPEVITESASWRNYIRSGYDRGHLCPAGDRRFSKEAFDETFYTSNITPQRNDFNAGLWNRLEQKVRYWAKKYDGIYVVTGGVLENGLETIGNEYVSVPEYFYKVLIDKVDGNYKAIAFLVPHEESDEPLFKFIVAIDEVEKRTGIDFFSKLPDDIENKLESKADYKGWSF